MGCDLVCSVDRSGVHRLGRVEHVTYSPHTVMDARGKTMAAMVRGYPATSDRSRGWLRYLYRKATTPDNWDKDGRPARPRPQGPMAAREVVHAGWLAASSRTRPPTFQKTLFSGERPCHGERWGRATSCPQGEPSGPVALLPSFVALNDLEAASHSARSAGREYFY